MIVKLWLTERNISYMSSDSFLEIEVQDKDGNFDRDYIYLSDLAQALKPFLVQEGLAER